MPADRITSIRAMVVSESTAKAPATSAVTEPPDEEPIGADPAGAVDRDGGAVLEHWITGKIAHPMSRYAEFRQHRSPGFAPNGGGIIVVVESESGQVGIASTAGGRAVAVVVEDLLAAYVVGESAIAHERIWDWMTSATLRVGRSGLVRHGVSAIDNAVWDLHGQIVQRADVELLGGSLDEPVQVYTTGPRPDIGKALGFAAAKLPLTWAPCEGEEGLRRNVEMAREARVSVGEDFPLLYDCWMCSTSTTPPAWDWSPSDCGSVSWSRSRRRGWPVPGPLAFGSWRRLRTTGSRRVTWRTTRLIRWTRCAWGRPR